MRRMIHTLLAALAAATLVAAAGCGTSADERDARKFDEALKAELYREAKKYEAEKARREEEIRRQFALGDIAKVRSGTVEYAPFYSRPDDRMALRKAIAQAGENATVTLTVPSRNAVAVEAELSDLWAAGRKAGPYRGRLVATSEDGVQTWEVTVPAPPAQPGEYTVTVTGRSAAGEKKQVSRTIALPMTPDEEQAAWQEQRQRDLEELRRLTQQAVQQLDGGVNNAGQGDRR